MTAKRFAWVGVIVVFSLPATGVPDEALSRYAVPQQLVRLKDGRHIHLLCLGRGSPTVILTAGLSNWVITWSKIHEPIAHKTRACAWDRPGFGYSDPDSQPQDVAHTTADLEEALVAAHIHGPYVLVGHSMGGYESLRFADRHPKEVLGMVLIDPSFPDQSARFAAVAPKMSAYYDQSLQSDIDTMRRCAAELAKGTLTMGSADPEKCFDFPANYPQRLKEAIARMDSNPAHFLTQASTFQQFGHSSTIVVNPARQYGDMPLRILTAGQWEEEDMPAEVKAETPLITREWDRAHQAMAALSTDGTNVVVDSTHDIQEVRPEVVIASVDEVVDKVRERPSHGRPTVRGALQARNVSAEIRG